MAKVSKRVWTHSGTQKTAWVVRYKEGGKHRSKQFEKKKAADAFRVRIESLEARGAGLVDSTLTFRQVAERFLNYQEDRLRDGRIGRGHWKNMELVLRLHLVTHLGDKMMDSLTAAQVEDCLGKNDEIRTVARDCTRTHRLPKSHVRICRPSQISAQESHD